MKKLEQYAYEAKELLTNSEMFEIKAGGDTDGPVSPCTFCAKECVSCSACVMCTTCKACTTTVMDVIVIP